MTTHYLKLTQPFFSEVQKGTKTFEHRKNDRDYQVGDEIVLMEYDPRNMSFSGQEINGVITYVLTNRFGMDEDFCVFSFRVIGTPEVSRSLYLPTKEELIQTLFNCAKVKKTKEGIKMERLFDTEAEAILSLITKN